MTGGFHILIQKTATMSATPQSTPMAAQTKSWKGRMLERPVAINDDACNDSSDCPDKRTQAARLERKRQISGRLSASRRTPPSMCGQENDKGCPSVTKNHYALIVHDIKIERLWERPPEPANCPLDSAPSSPHRYYTRSRPPACGAYSFQWSLKCGDLPP